jgi:hypothetical protein
MEAQKKDVTFFDSTQFRNNRRSRGQEVTRKLRALVEYSGTVGVVDMLI